MSNATSETKWNGNVAKLIVCDVSVAGLDHFPMRSVTGSKYASVQSLNFGRDVLPLFELLVDGIHSLENGGLAMF